MARISATSGMTASDKAGLVEIRENNLKEVQSALNQGIAAALEEIGLAAERFAKQETPVDTGRLRNSITHAISMDEKAVYVGSNVEYARIIELGRHSPKREGVHMLEHAAANHGDYYRNVLKKHMENA
jgi:phage gpG-like protein